MTTERWVILMLVFALGFFVATCLYLGYLVVALLEM